MDQFQQSKHAAIVLFAINLPVIPNNLITSAKKKVN